MGGGGAVGGAGGDDSDVRGVGSSDSRSGEDSRDDCNVRDGGDSDSGSGGYGWRGREQTDTTDKQEDKRTGSRHGTMQARQGLPVFHASGWPLHSVESVLTKKEGQ